MNSILPFPDHICNLIMSFGRTREAQIVHDHMKFIEEKILNTSFIFLANDNGGADSTDYNRREGARRRSLTVKSVMISRLTMGMIHRYNSLLLFVRKMPDEHELLFEFKQSGYKLPRIAKFFKSKKRTRPGEKRYMCLE